MEHEVKKFGSTALVITDGINELVGLDLDPRCHELTPEQRLLKPLDALRILGHLNLREAKEEQGVRISGVVQGRFLCLT